MPTPCIPRVSGGPTQNLGVVLGSSHWTTMQCFAKHIYAVSEDATIPSFPLHLQVVPEANNAGEIWGLVCRGTARSGTSDLSPPSASSSLSLSLSACNNRRHSIRLRASSTLSFIGAMWKAHIYQAHIFPTAFRSLLAFISSHLI